MKTTNRIGLFRDPQYAPCSFLLIKVDEHGFPLPYRGEHEKNYVLVQTDWDHPSIANAFGATFDCDNTAEIGKATAWLRENASRADLGFNAEVTACDPGYFTD